MCRTSIKITRNLTAALVVAAAVAPAASSASPDLSSPDAHDALVAAQQTSVSDPRSPDAKDAGLAAQRVSVVDPRSPDAKDAGLDAEQSPGASPDASDAALTARWGEYQDLVTLNSGRTAAVVPAVATTDPPRQSNWENEGIIAGGTLALMLAGVGVVLLTRRNRVVHPRNPAAFG